MKFVVYRALIINNLLLVVGKCACNTNFDELISEAGLFHIMQSQDMSGWLAVLACHFCPSEIEK